MKRVYKSDFVPHVGEVNDGKRFGHYVETVGYVPVQRQVDSFFRAGQRIVDAFSDSDYDTSEDDPVDDPTLDCRDFELEEVGAAMAVLGCKLESSRSSAAESLAEAGKNVILGTPEESGAKETAQEA